MDSRLKFPSYKPKFATPTSTFASTYTPPKSYTSPSPSLSAFLTPQRAPAAAPSTRTGARTVSVPEPTELEVWVPALKSAVKVPSTPTDDATPRPSGLFASLMADLDGGVGAARPTSRRSVGRFAAQGSGSAAPRPEMSDAMRYLTALVEAQGLSLAELAARAATPESPLADVASLKSALLRSMASSLIREPSLYNPDDMTRIELSGLVSRIAVYDPEFILKAALYLRQDLNIRITANLLLALAVNIPATRPFVRKYFDAATRLPSDVLVVVGLYYTLRDRTTPGKGLPAVLRKAVTDKFASFDAHQLAKYKSAKSVPDRVVADSPVRALDMKDLVRRLHIAAPVDNVMSLLGKRYPKSMAEFKASGLPGSFDVDRAGKRMKLAVPITWETQISADGNSAPVWESLIDRRKLPFMAMLRNLRNMMEVGISFRHHSIILSKLTTEREVVRSRQFPFRFFSAYDAVNSVVAAANRNAAERRAAARILRDDAAPNAAKARAARDLRKIPNPETPPDDALVARYVQALDSAIKIATSHNVQPIKGATLVLCNVGVSGRHGARGMGSSVRTVRELGVLMGLMCKHVAEDCDLMVFGGSGKPGDIAPVDLTDGTILQNMEAALAAADVALRSPQTGPKSALPLPFLESLIRNNTRLDAIVLLDSVSHAADASGTSSRTVLAAAPDCSLPSLDSFLTKYRQEVNPDMLFVSVDLTGSRVSLEPSSHPNDVYVAGFSGAILSFIAQRGDANQLQYVDHIDTIKRIHKSVSAPRSEGSGNGKGKGKGKKSATANKPWSSLASSSLASSSLAAPASAPSALDLAVAAPLDSLDTARLPGAWTTARVFVSSTFRDFHGERDILSRVVFPELRTRAAALRVHVDEVDLRWGVNDDDVSSSNILDVCLSEVANCAPFFVGLLGSRYGRTIDTPYAELLPTEPQFDWARDYPVGRSVTELEMVSGALANPDGAYGLFYIRNDDEFRASLHASPDYPDVAAEFEESDPVSLSKLDALKTRVRDSANFYEYPASYAGRVNGKASAGELDDFAARVLDDLWAALLDHYGPPDNAHAPAAAAAAAAGSDTDSAAAQALAADDMAYHQAFAAAKVRTFVGRSALVRQVVRFMSTPCGPANPILAVVGGPGMGKSALIARAVAGYIAKLAPPGPDDDASLPLVVTHFVGATPGSSSVVDLMVRVASQIAVHFGLASEAADLVAAGTEMAAIQSVFANTLRAAAAAGSVIVVIDGLDELDDAHAALDLGWLPDSVPIRLVVSAAAESRPAVALAARDVPPVTLTLDDLDFAERRALVSTVLARYRKNLDESPYNNQMQELITKRDSGSPLYLMLACEELRLFGVYEALMPKLRGLGPSVPALLSQLLDRLEEEHAPDTVRLALSLLCVARSGLLDSELATLLGPSLSPARWTALKHSIAPYMAGGLDGSAPRSVMAFFHGSFRDAVQSRYLASTSSIQAAHHQLAAHFEGVLQAATSELVAGSEASAAPDIVRAGSEVIYHMLMAGDVEGLESLLGSLAFVYARAVSGTLRALSADYALVLKTLPEVSTVAADFERFVAGAAHVLAVEPAAILQAAANAPYASHVAAAARRVVALDDAAAGSLWLDVLPTCVVRAPRLAWINKPLGSEPVLRTLTGATQAVTCVSVSPTGRYLAAGARDGDIRVYDTLTGDKLVSLVGHTNWVSAVAFAPDETSLVSGSYDASVRTWDLRTGETTATLTRHRRRVSAVDFSPDGRKILSASWDGSALLWQLEKRDVIYTFAEHMGPVSSAAFSSDGYFAVTGSWDTRVCIWNTRRGTLHAVCEGHARSVRDVAFSPDGTQVASVSVDGTLRLWSSLDGAAVAVFGDTIASGADASGTLAAVPLNAVAYSPDGGTLVTGSQAGTAAVWSGKPGKMVTGVEVLSPGEGRGVCALALSPSGTVALGCGDGTVQALPRHSKVTRRITPPSHSGVVMGVAWLDATRLVSVDSQGGVCMTLQTSDKAVVPAACDHVGSINAVAAIPTPPHETTLAFVTGGDDTAPRLWCVDTSGGCDGELTMVDRLAKHDAPINALAVAPHGRVIVSGGRDSHIVVTRLDGRLVTSGTTTVTSQIVGRDWVSSLAYSRDGMTLAVGSWDLSVTLLNLSAAVSASPGTEFPVLAVIEGFEVAIDSLAFHPAGALLAAGDAAGCVSVWSTTTYEPMTRLENAASGRVGALVWDSEEGLYVGADDGCVGLFQVMAGDMLVEYNHGGEVGDVAFVPGQDPPVFASVSTDALVKLWGVGYGEAVPESRVARLAAQPARHDARVTGVLALDNGAVLSCSDDGTLKVWSVETVCDSAAQRLELTATLAVHAADTPVSSFAVTDGLILSASHDGSQFVTNAESLTPMARLERLHTNTVSALAAVPGVLASGSWDGTLAVHTIASSGLGNTLFTASMGDWVTAIAWSPADGPRYLAGSTSAGVLKIWTYDELSHRGSPMTLVCSLSGLGWVRSLAWSADAAGAPVLYLTVGEARVAAWIPGARDVVPVLAASDVGGEPVVVAASAADATLFVGTASARLVVFSTQDVLQPSKIAQRVLDGAPVSLSAVSSSSSSRGAVSGPSSAPRKPTRVVVGDAKGGVQVLDVVRPLRL